VSSSAADGVLSRAPSRVLAVGAAVVVAAAALVAVGRWEGRRNASAQVRGMRRIAALIGPLDAGSLSGYRRMPEFDCLVYRRGSNPFALELCVDPQGRVVEAIDRRRFDRRIYDLHSDPSASTLRVSRAEVDRLLRKMGAEP
jgi:hypothetical protein